MNPKQSLWRLLVTTQLFSLLFLVLMPLVIRLLPGVIGKFLYTVLVAAAVYLAVMLRRVLKGSDV